MPVAGNWRYNDLCTWTCNRGYCPDVSSSNTGCVSGTGSGNYAGLYDFSCGRGFCSEPCVYLVNGTVDTNTTNPLIIRYAAPGMEQATYNPLCNFTCSHGYCPSPNTCVEEAVGNPNLTESLPPLPILDNYNPEASITYTASDFLRYDFEGDSGVSISVSYMSDPVELPTGIVCNDITPGTNGDFIGYVGETVEWLMLSIIEDPDIVASRDISSSGHYTYATLPDWQAQDNCSTHCRLQAEAPSQEWVPVGEGTYKGRAHSLHFKNTGKNFVYKAYPGSLIDVALTTAEKRFVPFIVLAAVITIEGGLLSVKTRAMARGDKT
ncbi:Glucan endo-1,3-alpha-glucosidase agn1 [Clarireedia jacksonii]